MLKLLREEVERLRLSLIWALRMLIAWVASVAEKVRFLRKSPGLFPMSGLGVSSNRSSGLRNIQANVM